MKSTKVFQVIKELSRIEIKELNKFLLSPYFNKNQSMILLTNILVELAENQIDLSKDSAWYAIGEVKDYDDVRFRKYCSDLLKLIERFLAQREFDANPMRKAAYLLKVVSGKRIEHLYNSSLRIARRLSSVQDSKGIDYLFDVYQIERYHQVILEADDRAQKFNVELIVENLDKFYIAQKLLSYMTAMSQKRIVDLEYDLLFIDEILLHIEHNPYPDTPQIRILYLIAILYQTNDSAHYRELKALLLNHVNLFPPAEANNIFRSTLNFLIGWLNEGQTEQLHELFEMYNYALKQEFFFLQQGFNPWIFKSIVIVALRLKEFDWCEDFIQNYSKHLDSDSRENAVRFNTARLRLYQKQYDRVVQLLSRVEFDDFSYNLGAKALLLATYYELDEIEALYSFLDSFKIFLRRNNAKLPKKRQENYLNLIKYTKHLSKLTRRDKKKLGDLKIEIQNKANLGDKRWILEKIDEKL